MLNTLSGKKSIGLTYTSPQPKFSKQNKYPNKLLKTTEPNLTFKNQEKPNYNQSNSQKSQK